MAKIVLISCVSKKRDYSCKARDLYISELFKKSLDYAEKVVKADNIKFGTDTPYIGGDV